MKLEEIFERYPDCEFLIADEFNDAVIGVEENEMRLIYSVSKCLEVLEKDMTQLDAMDYFTYNVSGAYLGEKTPIWCWDI
jgi:hypothetical protein